MCQSRWMKLVMIEAEHIKYTIQSCRCIVAAEVNITLYCKMVFGELVRESFQHLIWVYYSSYELRTILKDRSIFEHKQENSYKSVELRFFLLPFLLGNIEYTYTQTSSTMRPPLPRHTHIYLPSSFGLHAHTIPHYMPRTMPFRSESFQN